MVAPRTSATATAAATLIVVVEARVDGELR
jgi:hypothetical protein